MASHYSHWQKAPKDIELGKKDIQLWRIDLHAFQENSDKFFPFLSSEEKKRSERFYFERDKKNYIITRGVLRKLLGNLLQRPPSSIHLTYGEHGKPFLKKKNHEPDIRFNVSHSKNFALIAFTLGRDIGVDVEYIRKLKHISIARRFFSDDEVKDILSLPSSDQLEAFFSCWTRKEAYIKAKGGGLSLPLRSFTVSPSQHRPASLIYTYKHLEEVSKWSIYDVVINDKYKAALAVREKNFNLLHYTFISD
jgi:4'-phosphopantetheinyl transferase